MGYLLWGVGLVTFNGLFLLAFWSDSAVFVLHIFGICAGIGLIVGYFYDRNETKTHKF